MKEKTYQEKILEEIEDRVIKEFTASSMIKNADSVAEVHNVSSKYNETDANKEKLLGKFDLKLSKTLTMPQKMVKYAHEPVVFYLHKNRNFIHKLRNHDINEQKLQEEKEYQENLKLENE